MFTLEIEYLLHTSFASQPGRKDTPEWPPHPDRLFLALVAAWGESTKDQAGADALRWLEKQEPPSIRFPEAHPRDRFVNFVPTSSPDEKITNALNTKTAILQIHQSIVRKERQFPATALPDDDPKVHMVWKNADPSPDTYRALSDLASRVSRIGHTASIVRVATVVDAEIVPNYVYDEDNGNIDLRCPHQGRFDSIVNSFDKSKDPDIVWRPMIAPTRRYAIPGRTVIRSVMGGKNEWVTLAFEGEPIPTLTSFPIVAKRMRDAIMHHADNPIHSIISGHDQNGASIKNPHLAIIPMANVGWGRYSDGSLMGISMILPRMSIYGKEERSQLRQAVSRFLRSDRPSSETLHHDSDRTNKKITSRSSTIQNESSYNTGLPGGKLNLGRTGVTTLKRSDGRKSLHPDRYVETSRTWASVTPMVLDHHPKNNHGPKDIISDGCARVSLPRPVSVSHSRHSSVAGVPSAYVARGTNRGWMSPKPGFLDNKFICHAVIDFGCDVEGPVMLGAGRYYGLGLFLPFNGAR